MLSLICKILDHKDVQIHGYAYDRSVPNITTQKVVMQCTRCGRKENVTWTTLQFPWKRKK